MLFTCADDGLLKCWDLRQHSVATSASSDEHRAALCIQAPGGGGPREFLCADISADDNFFACGTNKTVGKRIN